MKRKISIALAAILILGSLFGCTPKAPALIPTEPAKAEFPSETIGQKNATDLAIVYLTSMPFSAKGLADQLKYEGFADADVEYAVFVLNVDWKFEAARMAKQYLKSMPMSKANLIKQLEYEGFTKEEATYGAAQAGY